MSDKPAFTPPGHIKRQQCKSKEAFFFFAAFFFNRSALGAFIQNFFSGGLLVHSIFRPVILHAVHASLAIG